MLCTETPFRSWIPQVVPEGFGVAYMTGYDGERYIISPCVHDRLIVRE